MTNTPESAESSPAPTVRDELMLDSMGATRDGFGMSMHAGGPDTARTLLFIADSMRSALDGHNAPNYLEMEVKSSDGKHYILTLQRGGKITPHQARVAAEEALEAAKPRTITTTEELDGLGRNAAILADNGAVWVNDGDTEEPWASLAEDYQGGPVWANSDGITLPATVLHEPAK